MCKASPLSLVHNAKDKLSNLKSVAGSKAGAKYELNKKTNLFPKVFAIKAD